MNAARSRSIRALFNTAAAIISARFLVLVMSALVARRLGPEGFGAFAFATGAAALMAQIASLGWPTLLSKLIPTYVHERDWSRMRGLNFAADLIVFAGMALMAALLLVAAFLFLDRSNPLFMGFLVAAALVVPSGLRLLNRQRMAAIGKAAAGIFLDLSTVPLIVLVALFVSAATSPTMIYSVYIFGTYSSLLVARFLYRRWTHVDELSASRALELKSWMLTALPMITAVASREMLNRIDVVMVAPLSSVYEVGLFNTAYRIAFLASMLPAMTNPVIRPMLAGSFAANEHKQIVAIMRRYYIYTASVALTAASIIFVFANQILILAFGAEFEPGAPVLRILVIGTFFGAVSEASASYLLMCGKERAYGILSVAGLAVAVGLNLWLIPQWGAKGAAITSMFVSFIILVAAVALVIRALKQQGRQVSGRVVRN